MRRLVIYSIIVTFIAVFFALGCGEEGPTESDIPRLERQIEQKDRLIGTLQKEIQQRDSSISSLESQIQQKDSSISSLEQQVSDYEHATQASTVVKGSIVVFAGEYADYSFLVSEDMRNTRLKGDFNSVSGGSLYVLVFDDLNFRNWKGGGDAKAWYSSGEAVVGSIDLPLAASDKYHLVFSNTHSWITKKMVDVSVDLQFQL